MEQKKPISDFRKRRESDPPLAIRRKRILLLDHHPMIRSALTQLINKRADMEVCGEAGCPSEAFLALSKLRVDLVLTDLSLPEMSGIEFIKELHGRYPQVLILVFSVLDEDLYAQAVLSAGASGYVMKEAGGQRILEALSHVLAGNIYVSEKFSAKVLGSLSGRNVRRLDSGMEKLTLREAQILQLIGEGKTSQAIAQKLRISRKTVDVHRGHIKEKLAVKNSTALIQQAVRWTESRSRTP